MLFEEDDITAGFLSVALNADCFNVNEEVLELETYLSIQITKY